MSGSALDQGLSHHDHHGFLRGLRVLSPRWKHKKATQTQSSPPQPPPPRKQRTIWSPRRTKKNSLDLNSLSDTLEDSSVVDTSVVSETPLVYPSQCQPIVFPDGTTLKGCLKVKTLKESINSTKKWSLKKRGVRFASEEHSLAQSNFSTSLSAAVNRNIIKNSEEDATITKQLGFSTIEIREYPIRVGDCPSLLGGGPPMTMDWSYESLEQVTVDDYEEQHPSDCRKVDEDLLLDGYDRFERLLQVGHTKDELYEATRVAEILARQRTGCDYSMW